MLFICLGHLKLFVQEFPILEPKYWTTLFFLRNYSEMEILPIAILQTRLSRKQPPWRILCRPSGCSVGGYVGECHLCCCSANLKLPSWGGFVAQVFISWMREKRSGRFITLPSNLSGICLYKLLFIFSCLLCWFCIFKDHIFNWYILIF